MTTNGKKIDYRPSFEFHGLDFRDSQSGQLVASCPFGCSDDSKTGQGHFFLNSETGQFCCKKCLKEGNLYTFLREYHAMLLKGTTRELYEELAESRRIPWKKLREKRLAYDPVMDRWLYPINNQKGSLANLEAFLWRTEEPKLMGTTGCAQHLNGLDKLKPTGPVYICEGRWDSPALEWLFEENNLDPSQYSILDVPGCGTFKKEWAEALRGRELVLLYDNDIPGGSGMDKVQKMMGTTCPPIRRIVWPSSLPEGYDIRDFVGARLKTPKRALRQFHALLPENVVKSKLKRTTFKSVLRDFKKVIHVSKTFEQVLVTTMAVYLSANVPKDPLWLFLVGPPGVGKTLLIHSFLTAQLSFFLSCLTKSQLVSGWRGSGDDDDPSVLPKLRGLCLFVEDYTTIKSLPLGAQEELYGLLRAAFNGKYDQTFGNAQSRNYEDLFFSMVAGVTDVIHGDQRATLGERFLKIDMVGDEAAEEELHLRSALKDVIGQSRDDGLLRESIATFLSQPFNPADLPPVPKWYEDRVVSLATLGSRMRAVVERKGGELLYRPRAEYATRLTKQLAKLGRFVAYVLGKSKIDQEVWNYVQKVALDTVVGFNLEILHALFNSKGKVSAELEIELQLSQTTIERRLTDLQELRVVEFVKRHPGDRRGPSEYVWDLAPYIREHWKAASISYKPKNFTADHRLMRRKNKKKAIPTTRKKRKAVLV